MSANTGQVWGLQDSVGTSEHSLPPCLAFLAIVLLLEVRHRKDEVFFKSTNIQFYIWKNFLKKHANLKKSM